MATPATQRRGAGTESLAHRDIVFDRQVYGRQLPPLRPGYRQRSLPDQVRCVGRNRIDVAGPQPECKAGRRDENGTSGISVKPNPACRSRGPRFALDAGTRTTVCANIKPDYIQRFRPGARRKPGGRFKRTAPGEPPSPMNPVSPLPAIGGNLARRRRPCGCADWKYRPCPFASRLACPAAQRYFQAGRQDNEKRKKAKP